MKHLFDTNIAKECGIEEAVILENIYFWCKKNEANNKLTDGKPWTYNSVKAFNELFDYMSPSKISRALKNLETKGFIIIGEFNTNAYDHTKWYCITDKTRKIFGEENENSNFQNENSNNDSDNSNYSKSEITITDINTNNKPNSKISSDKPKNEPPHFINSDNEVKKTTRSKKPSKTELNEQYISTLSAKESEESELITKLLITYLKPLQPTMHPETHLRAWQVEFAKFMKANNIDYDSMIKVINFIFASDWKKYTFAAKNVIDNYGKIYQQMTGSSTKNKNYKQRGSFASEVYGKEQNWEID